jgi:TATA-binding protein-associated factor
MEDNIDIQKRCAVAVASFIQFCAYHHLSQPPEKIVKNLCTFLCQDTDQTPTFAYNNKQLEGILSCQSLVTKLSSTKNGKENGKESSKSSEGSKAWLSRRGAGLAFDQLSCRFGEQLLEIVPNMWHAMTGGLSSAFKTGEPLLSPSILLHLTHLDSRLS